MAVIDIHNHVTPRRFVRAIEETGEWHTLDADVGELHIPKFSIPAEERIAEMDQMGVDVHVLTDEHGLLQVRPPAGRRPHDRRRVQRGARPR